MRLLTFLPCLAVLFTAAATAMVVAQPRLSVEGTEFVLTTADGRVLRSADLVGAMLRIGDRTITIRSIEDDPDAKGGRLVLHRFVVMTGGDEPSDLCTPDAAGRRLGFPFPDGRGAFDLACTSGTVGKCIRLGYRPWEETPGGPPLRALYQACTRMVRADYGGDGGTATRDGTLIDAYDRFGVQAPDREASMTFEAAWGVDGAICVARPRVPGILSLEQLAERYPRLSLQLGPAVCTEDAAMRNPAALLFNRSRE